MKTVYITLLSAVLVASAPAPFFKPGPVVSDVAGTNNLATPAYTFERREAAVELRDSFLEIRQGKGKGKGKGKGNGAAAKGKNNAAKGKGKNNNAAAAAAGNATAVAAPAAANGTAGAADVAVADCAAVAKKGKKAGKKAKAKAAQAVADCEAAAAAALNGTASAAAAGNATATAGKGKGKKGGKKANAQTQDVNAEQALQAGNQDAGAQNSPLTSLLDKVPGAATILSGLGLKSRNRQAFRRSINLQNYEAIAV